MCEYSPHDACSIWADCGSRWQDKTSLFLWVSHSSAVTEWFLCGTIGTAFCSYIIKAVSDYDFSLWNFRKHIREEVSVPDGRHEECSLRHARKLAHRFFMTYGQLLTQQLTVTGGKNPSAITDELFQAWIRQSVNQKSSLWVRGGSCFLQRKHKLYIFNAVTDLDSPWCAWHTE